MTARLDRTPDALDPAKFHDPQRTDKSATLAEVSRPVPLDHPRCAQFDVLGGASYSG